MEQGRGSCILLLASISDYLVSLLHLLLPLGGPEWYRFFGLNEQFAELAGQGSMIPNTVVLLLSGFLAFCGALTLSAAGILPRFYYLRIFSLIISGCLFLRTVFSIWVLNSNNIFLSQDVQNDSLWLTSAFVFYFIFALHVIGFTLNWKKL